MRFAPAQLKEWLATGTGRGVQVAVLDSGVETAHPDLRNLKLAEDVSLVENDTGIQAVPGGGRDVFGHGTAVCGIIHRLAPEAEITSVRVLGGQLRSRSAVIRAGARLALRHGCHILNCSFGCAREDHVLFYKDWVDEAYIADRHVVAACNNRDFARREWPGHFPSVITVNFLNTDGPADAVPDTTLYHRPGSLVEFLARGQDVTVPWRNGARKKVTGSSFACAAMTGLLARLLSQCPQLHPLPAKAWLREIATPWMDTAEASEAATILEASA